MDIGSNLVAAVAVAGLAGMLTAVLITVLTTVLTTVICHSFAVVHARVGLEREAGYRALAEQAARAQAKAAQELRTARVEIAELRERVFAMDTLLREVG